MKNRFQNLIYYTIPSPITIILRKRLDWIILSIITLALFLWAIV